MPKTKIVSLITIVLALSAVSVAPAAAADGPRLLMGGNPFVEHFTTVGSRVFFDADDGIHGRELFVSDGTPDGTHIVKDVYPGSGSGLRFDSGLRDLNALTAAGDRLFFVATDGHNGTGLYV